MGPNSLESMARFDDYHRTVIGYHGTGLTAALRIANRIEGFRSSERDYDWLGRGVYFWEYAPKQALNFAKIRQRQLKHKKDKTPDEFRRSTEPLAVVASMIRLGFCLDLTEPGNVKYLKDIFKEYSESMDLAATELPRNSRKYRKLDCAVFEYAYKVIEKSGSDSKVDTARGIYVATDRNKRIWPGSWISEDTHIQLCVRNPASLLGAWLHQPTNMGVSDVCKALRGGITDFESKDPEGESQFETDDSIAKD